MIWAVKNLSSPPRNNRSQLYFDFQSKIELLFNTGPQGIRVFGLTPADTVTGSHFSPIFCLINVLKVKLSLRISIVLLHMGSCESCSHRSVEDMELQLTAEPTLSRSVVFSPGENKSDGKLNWRLMDRIVFTLTWTISPEIESERIIDKNLPSQRKTSHCTALYWSHFNKQQDSSAYKIYFDN